MYDLCHVSQYELLPGYSDHHALFVSGKIDVHLRQHRSVKEDIEDKPNEHRTITVIDDDADQCDTNYNSKKNHTRLLLEHLSWRCRLVNGVDSLGLNPP